PWPDAAGDAACGASPPGNRHAGRGAFGGRGRPCLRLCGPERLYPPGPRNDRADATAIKGHDGSLRGAPPVTNKNGSVNPVLRRIASFIQGEMQAAQADIRRRPVATTIR